MTRRGRPPKFTPELAAEFCRLVGEGLSRAKAAAAVGITSKTVCVWMRTGRPGGPTNYVHFVAEVRAAEAGFVARNVASVVRAAGPRIERVTKTTTGPDGSMTVQVTEREVSDWRAAMWLLQCKDPETFGSHRSELRALKRELAALRRLLTADDKFHPMDVPPRRVSSA